MEEFFVNYNPKKVLISDFSKKQDFKNCQEEAVRLMKKEGNEIYIFKCVGVVKPKEDFIYEETTDPLPF